MKTTLIIPTYNRAHSLKRCLDSVFNQTFLPDEVIIIDDGSFDDTKKVLNEFSQDIVYIFQKNKGVSSARNRGITLAKYDWIYFLDSDDTWHTQKLEKQINFHKQNKHILFSHTNEIWIRNDNIPRLLKNHMDTVLVIIYKDVK